MQGDRAAGVSGNGGGSKAGGDGGDGADGCCGGGEGEGGRGLRRSSWLPAPSSVELLRRWSTWTRSLRPMRQC